MPMRSRTVSRWGRVKRPVRRPKAREQGVDHGGRRRLAVRPGHVDRRVAALRVAEQVQHRLHSVQRRLDLRLRRPADQLDLQRQQPVGLGEPFGVRLAGAGRGRLRVRGHGGESRKSDLSTIAHHGAAEPHQRPDPREAEHRRHRVQVVSVWQEQGTYRFDRTKAACEIYSIDTPPPTVSGSLHVGHVFSYTHTDTIARYQRMRGKRSSIRWDGTTTACRPSAGCRTTTASAATPRCRTTRTSPRRAAGQATAADQPPQLRRALRAADRRRTRRSSRPCGGSSGCPSTGRMTYQTIDPRSRAIVQRAFLRNLARGEAYQARPPRSGTSPSGPRWHRQSSRTGERDGAYHEVTFHRAGRPDAHDRHHPPRAHSGLRGARGASRRRAVPTALRDHRPLAPLRRGGPRQAHPLADPEKGTGIAMICTFGDLTDVIWWRELTCRHDPSSAGTAASWPTHQT